MTRSDYYMTMTGVRIADLKSRLSEHLRKVRAGSSLTILDRDTPIHVVEGDTLEILVPTLPDAPSTEQTVIPPMSVDELRAAAERAREQNRGES